MQKDLEFRLSKAKSQLILRHPFVGAMAMRMPFEITDAVPTAATDGNRVMFNPEFCGKLTDEEMVFLVAHECLHPMLEHNFRRGTRDPEKWNIAADYAINQLLVDENIGSFIQGGCLDKDIYIAGDGISEKIYDILPDSPSGGVGGIGNDLLDNPGSPAEVAQRRAEVKVQVAQAAQAARMAGKMSGTLDKLVKDMLNPRVDWRTILQRFVVKCRDDSRTWARPNRRMLPQGLYLPSQSGERMGELAVACDCSGSVSEEDYRKVAAELNQIHQDLRPEKIHVVYFDHEVKRVDTYLPEDTLEIRRMGGGGTAFSPIWPAIDAVSENLLCCVVLTDLYCGDFGDAPDYPVLWLTTGATQAPWGEVTKVED